MRLHVPAVSTSRQQTPRLPGRRLCTCLAMLAALV
jgi:hypothetical protein